MNDADIIKALECCSNGLCSICPYHVEEYMLDCLAQNGNDALDLIKRQQAEIERLQKEKTFSRNYMGYFPKLERIEAIKEFAEKLKDIVDEPALIRGRVIDTIIARIDNLVKEMTEGK